MLQSHEENVSAVLSNNCEINQLLLSSTNHTRWRSMTANGASTVCVERNVNDLLSLMEDSVSILFLHFLSPLDFVQHLLLA